ncbi:MAG: TfuA-like protein [Rubrivivax sp.]|nr:TfuA-like protein [Rubrivivax sp.]
MAEGVLFAGPSACGLPPALLAGCGLELRPPARRGDLARLVDEAAPAQRVLVLCDGVFQSAPAVSHAEICLALDRGWAVWGVSSLGAIRAHEMRAEGMRGWGWVYAQFARHADFTDDELCLLHLPEPPWLPLTEALVDVRHALARQGAALGIAPAARRVVVAELRKLWFGERSAERLHEILCGAAGVDAATAGRFLAGLALRRVKSLDLQSLLQRRPWAG